MTSPPSDGWKAGSIYEEFMGRWSRPLAREFVSWLEVPTAFSNFDDYWRPFLGGTGPAPSFAATLSEEQREALSADLRERLPAGEDGRIALIARAWAVAGLSDRSQ